MTPELERAARAMCRVVVVDGLSSRDWTASLRTSSPSDSEINGHVDRLWERTIPQLRAALLSIREPTEGMVEAGEAVDCEASAGWTMMVDYILGEFNP